MDETVSAFLEDRLIARGSRGEVTRALEQGWPGDLGAIRVFDDASGKAIDLDYWDAAVHVASEQEARGRGRPKLGVMAREVTLLPRHWEWLGQQPGGASAALRRLVEAARKEIGEPAAETARDAVYRFLTAMAGDRPGYEEAMRALYRGEMDRFRDLIANWPGDITGHAERLFATARS